MLYHCTFICPHTSVEKIEGFVNEQSSSYCHGIMLIFGWNFSFSIFIYYLRCFSSVRTINVHFHRIIWYIHGTSRQYCIWIIIHDPRQVAIIIIFRWSRWTFKSVYGPSHGIMRMYRSNYQVKSFPGIIALFWINKTNSSFAGSSKLYWITRDCWSAMIFSCSRVQIDKTTELSCCMSTLI